MAEFNITQIPQYFALAGFILWALVERWFYMSGQQQAGGKQKDRGTYWLISTAWYGTVFASILDGLYFHWTPQDLAIRELCWLGIPLIVIGILARILARQALGRQYSVWVKTSDSHQLVTQGIYGKLRHPAYFGTLNLLIGIPLGLWSLLGLGIALIVGIPTVLYRIKIEEEALHERFGDAYQEYAEDTWGIIPYLW
jgi:protein-S-isoprenylcysteine O-methyltransferase Ste14